MSYWIGLFKFGRIFNLKTFSMGKGDIKSRKGKIKIGSFGAGRPKSIRNVATKITKLGLSRK